MKKYHNLKPLEKDYAVDMALSILVTQLIETEFDYKFKSALAQKHFFDALLPVNECMEFNIVMESDEIAEELYPIAEMLAEGAYYPTEDDHVIKGIAI